MTFSALNPLQRSNSIISQITGDALSGGSTCYPWFVRAGTSRMLKTNAPYFPIVVFLVCLLRPPLHAGAVTDATSTGNRPDSFTLQKAG